MMKAKVACTALLVGLLVAAPATAGIVVSIDPAYQQVNIALGTTTVDIVADISLDCAIVQWGLDLGLIGTSVSINNVAINEVAFDAVFAPDGDDLAAIVPIADIPLSGNGILLATVTFNLDAEGLTDLALSDTPGDDNEGFFLYPSGYCTELTYVDGAINVVPEPAALALLVLCGLAIRRRR
ncbi:MAG: hypothetical protein ABII12_14400 [Planctomycetota bacterium]